MEKTPLKIAITLEGVKQRDLAAQVGVHESVISGLARGWRVPDEALASRIGDALGCITSELFPKGTK